MLTETLQLRSRKAQARTLNDDLQRVKESPEEVRQLSRQMGWLTDEAVQAPRRLGEQFDAARRRAASPLVDWHLDYYREFLETVDEELTLAARVRELGRQAAESSGEPFDPRPLEQAADELLRLRKRISDLLAWLNAPAPEPLLPPRSAAERKAALERGEYEDAEDLANRTANGEPLGKD
jgi:hypothetical protein